MKCEWYKTYKIYMKHSDIKKCMKQESLPQGIFVRKYFEARTRQNSSEQQSRTLK